MCAYGISKFLISVMNNFLLITAILQYLNFANVESFFLLNTSPITKLYRLLFRNKN